MSYEINHIFPGGEIQEFVCLHKESSLIKMCAFIRRPTGPHAHQFVHVVSVLISLSI